MTTTLAARARKRDIRADPMGTPCYDSVKPWRAGVLVSWYRGDPELGAWILWDDDELRRPRWEPNGHVVTGTGAR